MGASDLSFYRLLRFALVGGISTIAFLISQYILIRWAQCGLTLATTLSFAITFLISYFGHHQITFERSGGHAGYATRFLVTTVVLVALSNLFINYAVRSGGLTYMKASLCIAILYPLSSYVLQSLWVFTDQLRKN